MGHGRLDDFELHPSGKGMVAHGKRGQFAGVICTERNMWICGESSDYPSFLHPPSSEQFFPH